MAHLQERVTKVTRCPSLPSRATKGQAASWREPIQLMTELKEMR